MFAHRSTLTVPWGDCDPAGIVFYPRFFAMFDTATAALIEAATGRSRSRLIAEEHILSWPMIDTRAVFHAPVRFDDRVSIDSRITRLGNSSFDVEHRLWRGATMCVTATETRVWAAPGEGERAVVPRPLPDAIRARLAAGMASRRMPSVANERFDVVIVGGGHGGAQAAMALRQQKYAGTIAVIGEESELPYDRPPLSKEYLSGDKPWAKLLFHTAEGWATRDVAMRLGTRVVAVDADARTVTTDAGATIGYGELIWATGGAPRRLSCSGHDAIGVHSVRNRADVDRMLGELPGVTRAVVIGGGYIGLEAAAVLTKFDKQVVVLEALDRVLARVAGEPLSRFYEAEHRAHGVEIHLGVTVDCIVEQGGRATGVRLADGSVLPCEMVIVGIGIVPAVAPLLAARAEGGNGVRVDGQCRTSLPHVFAIGDCAEHRNTFAGDDWIRLESVQNANDQAGVVAKAIGGGDDVYRAVPWFWSNQYDLKLQTVGVSRGYDDLVVRGDPTTRSFSVVYLRGGAVIALDCVNLVRDYSHGKLLVVNASRPDRTALADATIPLKTLVAAGIEA